MKKLVNLLIEEEKIKEINEFIKNSNHKYKDRTHFITLLIQEEMKNEHKSNNKY